jgi:hypothetical protein
MSMTVPIVKTDTEANEASIIETLRLAFAANPNEPVKFSFYLY